MSLEQAVWRLTGQPAEIYGIKERGALRVGYHADLLLFDPRTVNRTPNRRVHDLPAAQPRLTGGAIGVHGVWVNGERIVDARGLRRAERLPGRVLREFAA
jgi:N-acyl-D-aspartate/D-glutamate deacylase